MTKEEWVVIAKRLKAVYSSQDFLKDVEAVDIWYELLKDLDGKTVQLSAAKWMQTEHFPPAPADLRKVTEKNFLSPDEAWAMVSDSLWGCTSREKTNKVFDKLPDEVQKTLGSADALYSYTQGEWNESVSKALFIKNYKPTVERLKQESRVSKPIMKVLVGGDEIQQIEG